LTAAEKKKDVVVAGSLQKKLGVLPVYGAAAYPSDPLHFLTHSAAVYTLFRVCIILSMPLGGENC
jgi:hypothetical protein